MFEGGRDMWSSRRIVLWVAVVALVLSVAVCQKQVDKAKTAPVPKATEMSSVPEETKPANELTDVAEEKQVEEIIAAAAEKAKAEEKKAAEDALAAKEEARLAKEEAKAKDSTKPAETALAKAAEAVTRDNAAAIIELKKGGRIVMEFYPKDAPNTVDNFIKLTNKGYYDGLKFHRVVPGFVVQGGDPRGDGTGGPGYQIKAEFNSRKHLNGTVAMARSQDPDSAGSQFYICLGPQAFLDGKYTVFGQVIEGMDLVEGIAMGDVMAKVTIVDKASLKK